MYLFIYSSLHVSSMSCSSSGETNRINTASGTCWTITKNHCMMHGQQNVKQSLDGNHLHLSYFCSANTSSAIQGTPHTLWNPIGHCRVHNSPTIVPVVMQINPAHAPLEKFLKRLFNIIFQSTSTCSIWLLSFAFPHPYFVFISLLPHVPQCPANIILTTFVEYEEILNYLLTYLLHGAQSFLRS